MHLGQPRRRLLVIDPSAAEVAPSASADSPPEPAGGAEAAGDRAGSAVGTVDAVGTDRSGVASGA